MINTMQASRIPLPDSFHHRIPNAAVPAVAMPAQTA
jgi:hypothetical protein